MNHPLRIFRSINIITITFSILFIASGCSSVKKVALEFDTIGILKQSEVFSQHHAGFSLFDIDANQFISNHNGTLLFTPASNTKLLTMYATLKNFHDSIPALLYQNLDRTTLVEPIGEPTFLLDGFDYQPVYDFLTHQESVEIFFPEDLAPYGPGWAWDDYPFNFQAQRSWWPIYGNRINITKEDTVVTITPRFFNEFVQISNSDSIYKINRDRHFNAFTLSVKDDTVDRENNIPFEYSKQLFINLLSDTLQSTRIKSSSLKPQYADTLYSQHVDTILSKMLKPSDNFLAEQLLILNAWNSGYSSIADYIEFFINTTLSSLSDMVWVDGSGLSRYNLISPNDQVRLLKKCLDEFGWERITNLLPKGGEGTLEEWYLNDEPFIFAKTGTLSNNHNLSGFLITKSGKKLIFSLMNNHYTRPTEEVKNAMEAFIKDIRDSY